MTLGTHGTTRHGRGSWRGPRSWLTTVAFAFAALVSMSACLWSPALEPNGYTRCESDADCAAGRSCERNLCAPPPWNDARFAVRQLFVVENVSEVPISEGAAVPVRVGAGGLISSQELGVDGRFTLFDASALRWETVPVFRDIYHDHLLAWIPLQAKLPPKASTALAWLETQTGERTPTLVEDPTSVFPLFDDFDGEALSPERFEHFGTGTPRLVDGHVNIADNQQLVALVPLVPPFSAFFRGKVNGVTCDRFYLGVTGDDGAGYRAPSAGLFAAGALSLVPEVAPNAESQPRPVGEAILLDNREHRFRIDVAEGRVRFTIDDDVVAEPELRPPFEAEALYLRAEVYGECSFDLERILVTPLPFEAPEVRAEARVEYEILN